MYDYCCFNPCCERGPIGPIGPRGPAGPSFETFGSFYEPTSQTLTTGIPVTLTQTITANNMTVAANSVFIPATGIYLIGYGVNTAIEAVAGNNIFLAVNGVGVVGTERAVSVSAGTNSTTILSLTAGDFVTLMGTAAGVTLTNIGGASANLSITRIN